MAYGYTVDERVTLTAKEFVISERAFYLTITIVCKVKGQVTLQTWQQTWKYEYS